jgi:hypothetical protein
MPTSQWLSTRPIKVAKEFRAPRVTFGTLTHPSTRGKIARMYTRNATLLILLAVCLGTGSAQTAPPAIKIGTHDIALGLPADEVIAALAKDYSVQANQDSPTRRWSVSPGKFFQPIATVYAKGNSIVGVQYMLRGRESNSAQDVFDDLYEAASKLSAEGHSACKLTTWAGYVAESSSAKVGISFNCGVYQIDLRRVQITSLDGKVTTGYAIWESLGLTE